MFICLYDGTEFSRFLQAEDLTGVLLDTARRRNEFSRSFMTVDKATSHIASTLLARSLYITSQADIDRFVVSTAQVNPANRSMTIGSLCRRLEFRCVEDMPSSAITALLSVLPNLEILILRPHRTQRG